MFSYYDVEAGTPHSEYENRLYTSLKQNNTDVGLHVIQAVNSRGS